MKPTKDKILYSLFFTKQVMNQIKRDKVKGFEETAQDVIDVIDYLENRYIKFEIDKFVKEHINNG